MKLLPADFYEFCTPWPEPVHDEVLGMSCLEEIKPFRLGMSVFRGNDFHLVSGLQHVRKRNQLHIDFRGNRLASYLRMDHVSKIQCCRTILDGLLFPLRSEYQYSGGSQVIMDDVQKFERIDIRANENFLHLGQPLVHFIVILTYIAVLLICPMRGDTFLRNVIHTLGANLHLDPDTSLAHQCTMQGLISVALGMLHPVAHTVCLVPVNSCDYGEYVITLISFSLLVILLRGIEDNPYGIEVVDLLEGNLLGDHLVPDGVRRLHALLDFEIETGIVQRLADRFYEFVNALFLVGHVAVYLGADVIIGIRLLVTQPDVLHLGLDLIETEPVRQRNENEHGLAQNLVALVFRHEFDGAAIVQTVS